MKYLDEVKKQLKDGKQSEKDKKSSFNSGIASLERLSYCITYANYCYSLIIIPRSPIEKGHPLASDILNRYEEYRKSVDILFSEADANLSRNDSIKIENDLKKINRCNTFFIERSKDGTDWYYVPFTKRFENCLYSLRRINRKILRLCKSRGLLIPDANPDDEGI